MTSTERLSAIWNQTATPVVLRRQHRGAKIRVRLPYDPSNKAWLQAGRRTRPIWNAEHRCWELPKSWFNDLVERSLRRWGRVYVVQPYREQEKCSPACMNARGHECECSCMGANHGQGNDGSWFEVSDTFATRWHDMELACRLMRIGDRAR